jgi:hypothetical protein
VLHSNFGCFQGTIEKSAAYKISGAVERRAVPIWELVENKEQQLKRKTSSSTARLTSRQRKTLPFALAAVKGHRPAGAAPDGRP